MTEDILQEIIKKHRVPVHVQKHMKKVAAVALYLGQLIKQRGGNVNLIFLRQAALLHDVFKICDFKILNFDQFDQKISEEDIQFWNSLINSYGNIGHIKAAENMLNKIGEHEIATIIRKHRFDGLIDEKDRPTTWEEKLLYYADKRVRHDKITSIAERLIDGRKRYFPGGKIPQNDDQVEKALYELEKEICSNADIKPEEINEESVRPFWEK
jgi:uncharacterized protein